MFPCFFLCLVFYLLVCFCFVAGIWTFEKTATSVLVLYREDLHLSAWLGIWRNSQTFFRDASFLGLYIISQLKRFASLFFLAFILLIPLVSVCGTTGSLLLNQIAKLSLILSGPQASKIRQFSINILSQAWKKNSPSSSSSESWNIKCMFHSSLSFSKEKQQVCVFSWLH